jgi:hypothetical protein
LTNCGSRFAPPFDNFKKSIGLLLIAGFRLSIQFIGWRILKKGQKLPPFSLFSERQQTKNKIDSIP